MDGVVSKLSARVGQLVSPGMAVAQVVPQSNYVVANFKETQVGNMKPGQEVDIEIDQPSDRFQAGMTGELAFVVEEKASAHILPSQAVQKSGAVYVVRDGRIVREMPVVGVRAVDRVEIVSGLAPGEQVVLTGP